MRDFTNETDDWRKVHVITIYAIYFCLFNNPMKERMWTLRRATKKVVENHTL